MQRVISLIVRPVGLRLNRGSPARLVLVETSWVSRILLLENPTVAVKKFIGDIE